MALHNTFGQEAETRAVTYLMTNGYTILERNYRFGKAEIDIIARLKDVLIVVEVKARSTDFFGSPETFVSRKKIKLLVDATNHYIEQNNLAFDVRFDIIVYVAQNNQWQQQHIEGAFGPWEW